MATIPECWAEPAGDAAVGVLVLAGSSGRVEESRCALLARHGALAHSYQWFGAEGQPPGICEIPLEDFAQRLDALRERAGTVAVLGVSKGAEAALLLGSRVPDLAAVVACAPTPYVWANVGPGRDGRDRPQRSSWSWRGEPLPFVRYDDAVTPARDDEGRASFRHVYEASIASHPGDLDSARIPVDFAAPVVLVAGQDDRMWPSVSFAEQIVAGRGSHRTELVVGPRAGHRVVLPGETPPMPSAAYAHGGDPEADADLGRAAWSTIVEVLGLPEPAR